MTDSDNLRLSVLDLIHGSRQATEAFVYDASFLPPLETRAILRSLTDDGYIYFTGSVYKLTDSGRLYRRTLKDSYRNSDKNPQRKVDKVVSPSNVHSASDHQLRNGLIVQAFGLIMTRLIPYLGELFQRAAQFFQSLIH